MTTADLISILINLAVGYYLAIYYPRSLHTRFRGQPLPPAFALLRKILPPVGWAIIIGSIGYAILLLSRSLYAG